MIYVHSAIGWCLYCLAKYKEQQEICRKEIRDILTGRDSATITWYSFYEVTVSIPVICLGKIYPSLTTLLCVSKRH